jgi:hypothetical protein
MRASRRHQDPYSRLGGAAERNRPAEHDRAAEREPAGVRDRAGVRDQRGRNAHHVNPAAAALTTAASP